MNTTPALRLRHEHTIPLGDLSISGNFTLEAWVCPAFMDSSARLYPEKCYDGQLIRLKPGLYRDIADQHLAQLGSVCLPEYVEAVFFTEPDFKGEALALRDDLCEVPDANRTIGSALILDRSHLRQNYVVLFEQPGFQGKAQVMLLLDQWRTPKPSASGDKPTDSSLTQVGSIWAPPGIVIETHHAYGFSLMHGDLGTLPEGVTSVQARRDAPLSGPEMTYWLNDDNFTEVKTPASVWYDEVPEFKSVFIPQDAALFLFEYQNLSGRHEIITGSRDDLNNLPFKPRSGAFALTPKDVFGLLLLEPEVKIIPSGAGLPSDLKCACLPGYCLEDPSGQRVGKSGILETKNDPGNTVVQYVGILSNADGYGLTLERKPGALKGAPDELRFGGMLLRTDRWYHLAQTWDGQTLRWILDGKAVKQLAFSARTLDNTSWVLGQAYRGSMAQLRVWNQALTPDQIRDQRYPDADLATNSADFKLKALPDLRSYAQAPDAFVVSAELPQSPATTGLVQSMRHQVEAEHQQNMQAARQDALAQTSEARKQAQQKLARAREQARRQIHFGGIENMGFVRGNVIWEGNPKSQRFFPGLSKPNNVRVLDAFFDGKSRLFAITDGALATVIHRGGIRHGNYLGSEYTVNDAQNKINPDQDSAPRAMAVDVSGKYSPEDNSDGYAWVYWVLSDGKFYRSWYQDDGEITKLYKELFQTPTGPSNAWDLALDTERQLLYWTNGRELYSSKVDTESPTYSILLPHAASFSPVAVAVAPDGSLIWLDAEAEMVRMLPFDQTSGVFGKIKELYPAPKPGRGLAVCSLEDAQKSGEEAAFVYWVARESRTLELPILDTPGRYIDFSYDKLAKHKHPSPVANTVVNAVWEDACLAMPFLNERNTKYGPFSLENGFVIHFKINSKFYFGGPGSISVDGGYLFGILSLDFDDPIVLADRGIRISKERVIFYDAGTALSSDTWVDIKVEVSKEGDNIRIKAYNNDRQFVNYLSDNDEFKSINVCQFHIPNPTTVSTFAIRLGAADDGLIRQVLVTDLRNPDKVLAKRDCFNNTGKVRGDNQGSGELILGSSDVTPNTKVLKFSNPEDIVLFEPVYLHLDQGWTVSAEVLWDGPSGDPKSGVCVYELASFEGEDRLVCAIDPNGMPLIYVRWNGKNLYAPMMNPESGKRLRVNELHKITWLAESSGKLSAYVDDTLAWEVKLDWPGGIKVFETHQLGAPCTEQTHQILRGALYNDPYDALLEFDPFKGSIHAFRAWNIYVPNAINDPGNTPQVDASWARSVLTVESKLRYLHAGRLDGQEPSVTLFPIDMDGGLFIKTSLDQAHAQLTQAHNQQVSANAYALHLKEDALQKAQNQLQSANKNLSDTQAQTAADKAQAQDKANADKAAARQQKADADAKAQRDRSAGADSSDNIRATGKQQAETQELGAADEKSRKIQDANSRLSEQQDALGNKQQELQDKRG